MTSLSSRIFEQNYAWKGFSTLSWFFPLFSGKSSVLRTLVPCKPIPCKTTRMYYKFLMNYTYTSTNYWYLLFNEAKVGHNLCQKWWYGSSVPIKGRDATQISRYLLEVLFEQWQFWKMQVMKLFKLTNLFIAYFFKGFLKVNADVTCLV